MSSETIATFSQMPAEGGKGETFDSFFLYKATRELKQKANESFNGYVNKRKSLKARHETRM